MSPVEGDELLRRVVDGQSQRVLNLFKWVLEGFKSKLPVPALRIFGPIIDSMVAHDPSSPNGLSVMANATLELAKGALIAQMRKDIKAGHLDERRIATLLGEGAGAAVVGELVLAPITQALRVEMMVCHRKIASIADGLAFCMPSGRDPNQVVHASAGRLSIRQPSEGRGGQDQAARMRLQPLFLG